MSTAWFLSMKELLDSLRPRVKGMTIPESVLGFLHYRSATGVATRLESNQHTRRNRFPQCMPRVVKDARMAWTQGSLARQAWRRSCERYQGGIRTHER